MTCGRQKHDIDHVMPDEKITTRVGKKIVALYFDNLRKH